MSANTTTTTDGSGWGRRRLLTILAATLTTGLALIIGVVCLVVHLVTTTTPSTRPTASGVPTAASPSAGGDGLDAMTSEERRDRIAATPMLAVPASAASPTASPVTHTAAGQGAAIRVPTPAQPGPASVLTGYPHTAVGAVGQLAQIDATVLQAMSLASAHQVYAAWALPGGTGEGDWSLTRSVAAFLDGAGMGPVRDLAMTVTATPAGALVKGTDGPDWAVACVLLRVGAVYQDTAQVAFGDCQRMQWVGGRWMIGPGTPPAAAPSTWPGTALAYRAGWRDWASDIGGDRR